MPVARIDLADLSQSTKMNLLQVAEVIRREVEGVIGHEVNGLQITLNGRDQPPTIDMRFI